MRLFRGGKSQSDGNPGRTALDRLQRTVEGLPWFGEEPFLASAAKHVPPRVQDDIPYIRRILISWLIGRPVSQIARRAGCSPRLAHKIINGYFYGEPEVLNWHFEQWFEIGLIAAIDTPEPAAEGDDEQNWPDWLHPGDVAIACLVCHRLIGDLPYEAPGRTGEWIQDVSPLLDRLWFLERPEQKRGALIQGHLMCHFALDYDPIRPLRDPWRQRTLVIKATLGNASSSDKRSLAAMEGTMKRKRYRSTSPWATGVLDEFIASESGPMLPIRDSHHMSVEQARRWWKGMI